MLKVEPFDLSKYKPGDYTDDVLKDLVKHYNEVIAELTERVDELEGFYNCVEDRVCDLEDAPKPMITYVK